MGGKMPLWGCPMAAGTLQELPAGMNWDVELSWVLPVLWATPGLVHAGARPFLVGFGHFRVGQNP